MKKVNKINFDLSVFFYSFFQYFDLTFVSYKEIKYIEVQLNEKKCRLVT